MKFLIVAALCLGAVQAFTGIAFPNEESSEIQPRIVGGWVATANQFPWQVVMQSTLIAGGTSWCGGSLLSNQWVLTTAHCTTGVSSFNVRLGSNNRNTPLINVNTANRIVHPNYNPNTLASNLALIRLPSAIALSPSVQPIRLPSLSQANTLFTGEVTAVSGFGRTTDNSGYSDVLMWTNVTVIDNAPCAQIFGNTVVTPNTVCARGTPLVSQNTCNGDDGGALVYYQGASRIPVQIGIVSFVSDRGCAYGDPSGYVRVSKYINWISVQTGIALFP